MDVSEPEGGKSPDDGQNAPDYIESVKAAVTAWKAEMPGVIAKAIGAIFAPVSWLFQRLVPPSAIEGALGGFDWIAKNILTDASAHDIRNLRQCDDGANRAINFAIGVAIAEGAGAGFFGAIALPFDVPAIVTQALRCIRQVGVEYGYNGDSEEERVFVFSVLSAAGANSQEEKAAALIIATALMNKIAKETFRAMAVVAAARPLGADAAIIAIRSLAKQLGINLTKRKMLAAIPVIGAAVGASANGWFIREVGVAAQRLYQDRWLRDHSFIIDEMPQEDAKTTTSGT